MEKKLRILILEDVPADAELMERELRKGGILFSSKKVDTKKAFLKELKEFAPDLILGDYSLPSFDGLSALAIVQEKCPDIPFIFVSGSIGEELAIETLKRGATDYVLKDRLSRLVPGVNRALREVKERTDRKQAEMELKKERDRAQRYLDIAGVMLLAINADQKVVLINRKGCEILGYKEDEIIGRNWFDHFIPERDRKSTKTVYANLLAAEIEPAEYFENSVLTKSGTEKIIAWHNTVITDENGRMMGTLSSGEDITDRKRTEVALRESEKRYREVVENATEIIYTVDEKGNFTYANPAGVRVTGYSLQELRKLNYADLVLPDHRERVKEIYVNQFRKKLPKTYVEFPFFSKGREIIWFGQNSTLVTDGDKIVGFHTIARDITERKRAEEALRASEERYRSLFENMLDGYAYCKMLFEQGRPHDFIYLDVNPAFETLTGLKNAAGKKVSEVIPGIRESNPEVFEIYGRVALTGKRERFETYVPSLGIWFSVSVFSPARDYFVAVFDNITEHKRAEEALRASEQRYRNLVENAPDVIYTLGPDGTITSLNPVFERITGWPQSQWVGKPFTSILHPDDLSQGLEFFQRILKGEKIAPFELRVLVKSGDYLVAEFTVTTQIQNGFVVGLLGIVRDITEHKQAEEALRENEKKFRELFDEAPVGYFEYDAEGQITNVNRTELEMLGYTLEEMIGLPAWKFIVEEEVARDLIFAKLSGTVPPSRNLERTYRRKDGTTFPALVQDRLLRDAGGKILGIRATIQDITDRKRAEEGLIQSEENARQLARENATMAELGRIITSTLNIDEIYQSFTEEVEKIISFDRIVINVIDTEKNTVKNVYIAGKELHDRNVKDIYPLEGSGNAEMVRTKSTLLIQTEDFNEYKDRFPMLLSTFQAGFRSIMNVPLFSKGKVMGGLLLRSHKPYAYTDKDVKLAERIGSQIVGAIANAQLYIERIQAEQEREALQEQLRQSQKMEAIGRLAGGIAHDFNNLLTVIKGYSQLSLVETKEDDPLKENLEEIKKAAEKAADLTRQLLAFSRRQILEMKVLDLNTILGDLDKMLHRLIGEDIELVTLLPDALGRVKTDPGWVEQIIMNLAVNARDAMPKGGKLTIETANVELDEAYARGHIAVKPGRYVMLSVSDTGVGMTAEIRQQVFEPFFTTKERGKGTGLGLSTVYGIVKQSGGNIWVYSEPGQGTTFKIYLPRVDEPLEELKERVVKEELLQGKETVLVVEDEEAVRQLAVRILKRQGYTVLDTPDGEGALVICEKQKEPVHLILTDVIMPGMSGRQLAERCRRIRQDFKVLYMSGYTDNAIVHHGVLEEGMNYIQKPFTVEDLARKVREVLDK